MLLLNPGPVTLSERVRRSLLQPDCAIAKANSSICRTRRARDSSPRMSSIRPNGPPC